ncbi:MAG: pyridoxal phosphate-dependent aminotransferase [Muribaculaceae bacterium]|nr:pyridoxal phosphate-dependent aminotransferase [Muribaculaceae bacterium]
MIDFNVLTERRNSGSMKWDAEGDSPDIIPLWVADMDFRAAPEIIDALKNRVDEGIFGYTYVGSDYYDALINWNLRRHDWEIDRKRVIYTSGVVPALSAIIKALTKPGEGVILQTPAYNCFFSSIRNNKCRQIDNPLMRIEENEGFSYEIDFEGLEALASDPLNTLMILCNPHNPTGRVWNSGELEKVAEICRRNGVVVVSDEIHCELVHPDQPAYIPYATIDSSAIVCTSPSKAFNTAGLQIANIICPDDETQRKIDRAINDNEVCDVNPFGVVALKAAYNKSELWLAELIDYLDNNRIILRGEFESAIPEIKFCNSEATYLAWMDVSRLKIDGRPASGDEIADYLLKDSKVRIASGSTYGAPSYIRINYACPKERLSEAVRRMTVSLRKLRN